MESLKLPACLALAHFYPAALTDLSRSLLSGCLQGISKFDGKVARFERLDAAGDVLVDGAAADAEGAEKFAIFYDRKTTGDHADARVGVLQSITHRVGHHHRPHHRGRPLERDGGPGLFDCDIDIGDTA